MTSSGSWPATSSPSRSTATPRTPAPALAELRAVRNVQVTGGTLRITVEHGDRILVELTRALDAGGVDPRSIRLTRPTLDDVFLALTTREAAHAT